MERGVIDLAGNDECPNYTIMMVLTVANPIGEGVIVDASIRGVEILKK